MENIVTNVLSDEYYSSVSLKNQLIFDGHMGNSQGDRLTQVRLYTYITVLSIIKNKQLN